MDRPRCFTPHPNNISQGRQIDNRQMDSRLQSDHKQSLLIKQKNGDRIIGAHLYWDYPRSHVLRNEQEQYRMYYNGHTSPRNTGGKTSFYHNYPPSNRNKHQSWPRNQNETRTGQQNDRMLEQTLKNNTESKVSSSSQRKDVVRKKEQQEEKVTSITHRQADLIRIRVGSNQVSKYQYSLKHRDAVIVPDLFGLEEDWTMYNQLSNHMKNIANAEAVWNERTLGKTPYIFQKIIDRLCKYFDIDKKSTCCLYRFSNNGLTTLRNDDWNKCDYSRRASEKQNNLTVIVSFGTTSETSFAVTSKLQENDEGACQICFPQTNNSVFSFGRDAFIQWNAVPDNEENENVGRAASSRAEQHLNNNKGKISIVLWGSTNCSTDEKRQHEQPTASHHKDCRLKPPDASYRHHPYDRYTEKKALTSNICRSNYDCNKKGERRRKSEESAREHDRGDGANKRHKVQDRRAY